MLEDISNSRKYIDSYAKGHGVVLKPIIELGSSDLLIDFTRINLGLNFTVKEFTKNRVDNESIFEIPIDPPIPPRGIGLVKLKNVSLSNAAKGFTELLNIKIK